MNKTVLISGAGIGGSTLAFWLARRGFEVTVVERAAGARSSGNPVDVKGPAVDVVEQMGVMPQLRAAGSDVSRMSFVDSRGRQVAHVDLKAFQGSAGAREVEVPRADLANILLDAGREQYEFLWNDTITDLAQDSAGVDVTFAAAPPRRFDLVIGADGLHSAVRRSVFGEETAFLTHQGIYVATLRIAEPFGSDREVLIYNTPGRALAVHPTRGQAVAAFMFRHKGIPGYDHRDTAQHKRTLIEAFTDQGWRVPEMLDRVRDTDDLFFDSVSKGELPQWSDGRIALLGDAASCVSLFGDGTTLAIAGAYTLAEALTADPDDHEAAFRNYERQHRMVVEPKLNGVTAAAALLIPATRAGIAIRNAATRVVPAVTAVRGLLRPAA
ncbi:FAD-dependent monooxygenase [Nocardia sp. NBC_01009]|uniref:FAD-dependent monooxygenase n=1 Tax=Nocardia sp. NBC_01009 TaxID=2975996 RepID=UPI003865DDC5|nr:FAD-dependent monooxygenase [Nocardia sp. NBC_01009]